MDQDVITLKWIACAIIPAFLVGVALGFGWEAGSDLYEWVMSQ